MPVFQVDIQKVYSSEYITNVYHVNTATIADAIDAAADIADIEKELYPPHIVINALRASTPTTGDDIFITTLVNIPGTRVAATPDAPPFCRNRVDLSVGPTRPLRKFLLGVQQADFSGDTFLSGVIGRVQTDYVLPLVALGVVCNPFGVFIVSGALSQVVGMRQLKRASKRKTPTI